MLYLEFTLCDGAYKDTVDGVEVELVVAAALALQHKVLVIELNAGIYLLVEVGVALLAQDGLAAARAWVHGLNLQDALVAVECENCKYIGVLGELDAWDVAFLGDVHVKLACNAAFDVI